MTSLLQKEEIIVSITSESYMEGMSIVMMDGAHKVDHENVIEVIADNFLNCKVAGLIIEMQRSTIV